VTAVRRTFAAALGVVLVLLAAALGLRWVDVASRAVAAVQAVVPVAGAAVVVVTLLALVCGFRRLLLAGLALSLVVAALAVGGYRPASGPAGRDDARVTVLSSNLEFGGGDASQLVSAVRSVRADVVVLVELTPDAVSRLRTAGLDAELPYVVGHAEAGTTGAMVRSRWPLTLLDEGKGTGGSLFWEPYARVESPSGAFRVRAVHTRQPIVSASGWRQDLRVLEDWQRAQPTAEPLVMAGDFNASADHPAFRLLTDGLVDAHRALGQGWVRTWPQGRLVPPFVQLDHVLQRGLAVQDAGTVSLSGTDHAAVWARLAFP
jgi:endonuclease/exonuclease/phosphatase (EEP) superfamily protein YafD